jgi:hypothetical protein
MPKKLWKVTGPLKLWKKASQEFQLAIFDEVLEEVTLQEEVGGPEDVLVMRAKEPSYPQSYRVSRSDLTANAKLVSE